MSKKLKFCTLRSANHWHAGIARVEIDRNGAFGTHHANVLNELRRRTGAIRRLASVLPRQAP
ncbi:Hypothetical protein FKW44_019859 [Caligus rogercresseyi]|uniref:Uncharacterized protein n=1 Tax=Caligus rogercresseyi TaxID=217165 RepID=A0A7T8GX72_CALRO|nr:Hypothetical protein FKW44_019859 [Caligus rogercresseyi]